MTTTQGGAAWALRRATYVAADPSTDGLLDNADYSKLAAIAYGENTIDLDIETGTFDGNFNTTHNREVRARSISNVADGEGRWIFRPLPGWDGSGDVIIRLLTTLGASGAAGNEVAWKFSGRSYAIGDTLEATLPNVQTVYQDVSAQTAHVLTSFDITVDGSLFDPAKRFAMKLKRLAATYAGSGSNYTAGTFYLHGIDVIFTGYGMVAGPAAPA